MYTSIYVPVDNSDHSNRAVACAVGLGKAFSAKLVGCHVYAAKLHDYRFRQMEYTLPEEYIDEVELERQRKIHDSLITMGLKLISDSYLDGMSRLCGESGLAFEPRMMDGKHHIEILKDLAGSRHDLVVIGALGVGRARGARVRCLLIAAVLFSQLGEGGLDLERHQRVFGTTELSLDDEQSLERQGANLEATEIHAIAFVEHIVVGRVVLDRAQEVEGSVARRQQQVVGPYQV